MTFKHFKACEFFSNCSREEIFDVFDDAKISHNMYLLFRFLDELREDVGFPIYVNSTYRNKLHNSNVGGVPNSLHMTGRAADITCNKCDMHALHEQLKFYRQHNRLCELVCHETYFHLAHV